MKCEALVRRAITGKKRKKLRITHIFTRYHVVVERFHLNNDIKGDEYKEDEFEVCDGNVIVTVELEPGYGGCSCCSEPARINISYKCDKCGNEYFPELPNHEDYISNILTEYVAGISKTKRNAILKNMAKNKVEQEKAHAIWCKKNGIKV